VENISVANHAKLIGETQKLILLTNIQIGPMDRLHIGRGSYGQILKGSV